MNRPYTRPLQSGTKTVDQIGKLNFREGSIPSEWYSHILLPNGEPDTIAITFLSGIVDWYIPINVFDNDGTIKWSYRKFLLKKLVYDYRYWSEKLGYSISQVASARERLEQAGLIAFEYQDITLCKRECGVIEFFEPVPEKLKEITPDLPPYTREARALIFKEYCRVGHW